LSGVTVNKSTRKQAGAVETPGSADDSVLQAGKTPWSDRTLQSFAQKMSETASQLSLRKNITGYN